MMTTKSPADEKPQTLSASPLVAVSNGFFTGRRLFIMLMLGAMLSKMLGLVREVGMAHLFGTTFTADAFRAALTGVFLPVWFLQKETVPAVLIPMYRDFKDDPRAAQRFTALALTVTLFGALIIGCCVLASTYWVMMLVGGFSEQARDLTRVFFVIMAFGMPGAILVDVLSAGEIALGRSRLTTVRASLLNISIIVGLVIIFFTGEIFALPIAFVVAFNALALWGVFTLAREGLLTFNDFRWADITIVQRDFWRRIKPLLAMPVVEQANVWVERLVASKLGVGVVASVDYARAITESTVLLISHPLGLALLALPSNPRPREQISTISRPLLACGLPFCVWLGMYGPDIATVLFARGAFNQTAVEQTGQALRGISFGLWASTLGLVLLRLLNSAGQNLKATLIFIAGFGANMASNLLLPEMFAVQNHGPLVIGTGESLRGLILLGGAALMLGCGGLVLRLILLALPAALLMYGVGVWIEGAFAAPLMRLIVSGAACGGTALLGLFILRAISLRMIAEFWRTRFTKTLQKNDRPSASHETFITPPMSAPHTSPFVQSLCLKASTPFARNRGAMLFFHRMATSAEWSSKLHQSFYLNEAFMDRFLTSLKQENWDIVTVEEAARRVREGDFKRKFVNFSLDDGYRDTFEVVIPLFRKHQVPITIYIATGIPDGTLALWAAGLEDILMSRDRVETATGPIQLDNHAARVAAFNTLFALWDNNNPERHYREFCRMNGADEAALHAKHAMSWEMLEAARHDPFVEIAGHTVNHPHVAQLARLDAAAEMGGSLERLRERLEIPVRHFAFPYGQPKDCGPRDFDIARDFGFGSAATTSKRRLSRKTDVMSLPRINLNGHHQSLSVMAAHLAGLTSFLERFRRK